MLIINLLVSFSLSAQNTWQHYMYEHTVFYIGIEKENKIDQFKHYDFTNCLSSNDTLRGFIGDKGQTIRIFLEHVQAKKKWGCFEVVGIAAVDNNITHFEGEIKIERIQQFQKIPPYLYDLKTNIEKNGVIIAQYRLKEKGRGEHTGTFKGYLVTDWLINKDGKMQSSHFENPHQFYRNHQYIGKWQNNSGSLQFNCNFGQNRAPYSSKKYEISPQQMERIDWYINN